MPVSQTGGEKTDMSLTRTIRTESDRSLVITINLVLIAAALLVTSTAGAAVVNLTFTEDIYSFESTWQITDNGGGDFSGMDSIAGTFWQVTMTTDATPILQDTIAHVLGEHGEPFQASSFDYGMLPTTYFEETSFVVHGDGHQDQFTLISDYDSGTSTYNVTVRGLHTVPVPAAIWLFGSGIAVLAWKRRRSA